MNRISCLLLSIQILASGCGQMMYLVEQQTINGNSIHYQISGKGPVLVFIHGGVLDSKMWDPQVKTLKKNYRVLTYDIRGHGQSEAKNNESLDIDDLKQILDHLKIDKVSLVGHSLGAVIATDFVMAYPDLVEKLVLVSPGLIGYDKPRPELAELLGNYFTYLQKDDKAGAVNALTQLSLYGEGRALSSIDLEIERYVKSTIERYIDSGHHLRETKLFNKQPISQLQSIKQSTLLVYGNKDYQYIKGNVEKLKQELPYVRTQVFEDMGHLLNMEQAATFNNLLLSFLKVDP